MSQIVLLKVGHNVNADVRPFNSLYHCDHFLNVEIYLCIYVNYAKFDCRTHYRLF